MRLALVTNLYPPIQTGTSYYAQALAHAMRDRGHDVLVVTCRAGGEPVETAVDGVRVVRLPALRLPPNRAMLNFDEFKLATRPGLVSRLAALLREHGAEIVHQCGHLLDLTYATPRAARAAGMPSVCSVHAVIGLPGNPRLDALARAVDRRVVRDQAMRRYDAVLTLDRTTHEYVRGRYGIDNALRVPWGIDFDFGRYERRARDEGPLRVVSLGHITEMRSRETLLRAVAQARTAGVDLEVRIVGKECTLRTRRMVSELDVGDIVTLTGELPREQALEELSHADVQGNWITNPGVGSAAMESMAMGVPTMLWAEPDELIFAPLEHLGNAILVDAGDPGGIARTLGVLASDRELLARIGRGARETARASFGWPTAAEAMETLYGQVMQGSPS